MNGEWRKWVLDQLSAKMALASAVSPRVTHRDAVLLHHLARLVRPTIDAMMLASRTSDDLEALQLVILVPAEGWTRPADLEGLLLLGFPLEFVPGLPWPMIGRTVPRG